MTTLTMNPSKIATFSTVAELVEAGLVNVIFRDDESNRYDDSDFYYTGLNLVTGKTFFHVHSTTRASGFNDLAGSVMAFMLDTKLDNEIRLMWVAASIAEAEAFYIEHNIIHAGDVVQVSNPRARKHKGVEFEVTHKSEYRDAYGRVQTVYACGGDDIKTSVQNCTIIRKGLYRLEGAERIRLGLALR